MTGGTMGGFAPASRSSGARVPLGKFTRMGLERSSIAIGLLQKIRPGSRTTGRSYAAGASVSGAWWGGGAGIGGDVGGELGERVGDQDRWLLKRADPLVVVVDDLADAEPGQPRRIGADLVDRAVLARPRGREAAIAPRLEERDE